MKLFSKIMGLSIIIGLSIGTVSCHDDDDGGVPVPGTDINIIGEWLNDESDDQGVSLMATKYSENGSLSSWYAIVGQTLNLTGGFEGTYTYGKDDRVISEMYVSPFTGSNTTDRYKVLYADKYSMITSMDGVAQVVELSRVVDTYEMAPGAVEKIYLDDTEFNATSYVSTSPGVATVDAEGNITAVKRGFAFIKALSTIGTAVIKVNVVDVDNPLEDYFDWIGKPLSELEKTYGKLYVDAPAGVMTERTYNTADEIVEKVAFTYALQKVQMVYVTLRYNADWKSVAEAMDKKYKNESGAQTMRRYTIEQSGGKYVIMFDLNNGELIYMPYVEQSKPDDGKFTDAEYRQFEWLVNLPVADVCSKLGHTLTDEEWEDGFFSLTVEKNNLFDTVNVMFDESEEPYTVGTVYLRCKNGIEQSDIEDWYKKNYESTGDALNPYTTSGGKVYVSFKKSGSRLLVYYRNRKVRK